MRITPATPEDRLPFDASSLSSLLTEGDYHDFRRVRGAEQASYIPDSELILRWEHTHNPTRPLPPSADTLLADITEWHEPEQRYLQTEGIGVIAHQTYVVDEDRHNPYKADTPTIFTVVPSIPDLRPLFNQRLQYPLGMDPRRKQATLTLAASLRRYFLGAINEHRTALYDYDDARQYYGAEQVGTPELTPTVFDVEHRKATATDLIEALLSVNRWEALVREL